MNEILKLTDKEDWAYCSTEENPADLGSRGVLASQLKENQLWWRGPSWLTERPEDWPVLTESLRTPESLIEEKKSADVMMTKVEIVSGIAGMTDLNDYSTLQRLVRVTAWIKRLIDNSKARAKQNEKRTGKLEADELKCAEIEWLKSVQSDLKQQTNFKELVSELGIKEDRAILRGEGTLVNSDLESEARRPRVGTRYMGSGINSKKWGGIRYHSTGIWDHKPWDPDQHYCKDIRDPVFRHDNKDHKILKCALIGGACRHFSIQLNFLL